MAWLVVRVRGGIHARRDIRETLDHLHLTRPNHATVLPENPSFRGMLIATQGYLTWGEADPETVALLLQLRAETVEGLRLDASAAPAGAPGVAELAATVLRDGLLRVPKLKPLVRLRAPKGGWKSTKKPFGSGGALGYRGPAINELVRRMV